MQRKLVLLFLAGTVMLFALSVVLFTIADNDEEYKQIVLKQQSYESREIAYERGEILDRNGTVLAGNERVYNLILDPKIILENDGENRESTVNALVECYGYDREEIENILDTQPSSSYVRYERQMDEDRKAMFDTWVEEYEAAQKSGETEAKGDVVGVWFEEEYKRVYPYDSLASQVVGFASADGTSGRMGLEAYYNNELTGVNGREYGYFNDDATSERVIEPARNGYTLVTTLDAYVQQVCEKYVNEYNEQVGSRNTGVIVMNPQNGEVLAMAMKNSYNLNDPSDMSNAAPIEELLTMSGTFSQEKIDQMTEEEKKTNAMNEMWKNHCVSDTFEPGSTAKTFTIAAALEEGKITGNETYLCNGALRVGGHNIHCHNRAGHGVLTVTQTLMSSCNVGLMYIAQAEGAEVFTRYQEIFGFGQSTGIDLPYEATAAGLLYSAEDMGAADLATNSFGQNYNVTMIQIAAAYASILNGGNYYEPRLVKQIIDEEGAVVKNMEPVLVRKTVSTSTAEFMKNALYQTVEGGTGQKAAIEGYAMGGKTGTAEKLPRGNEKYVVSFVADVPADYPEVFIYVAIDEPNVEKQSDSSQATEMCRNILREILPYLNIYPTEEIEGEETEETEPAQETDGEETPEEGEAGEGEEADSNPITIISSEEIYEEGGFTGDGEADEENPEDGENPEADGESAEGGESGQSGEENPEDGENPPADGEGQSDGEDAGSGEDPPAQE